MSRPRKYPDELRERAVRLVFEAKRLAVDTEITGDMGDRTTSRLEIQAHGPLAQLNGVLPWGCHDRSISFSQDRAWFWSLQKTQGPSRYVGMLRQRQRAESGGT